MTSYEAALQITLKALEEKAILLIAYNCDNESERDNQNAINAKQINDFYNAILNNLANQLN